MLTISRTRSIVLSLVIVFAGVNQGGFLHATRNNIMWVSMVQLG